MLFRISTNVVYARGGVLSIRQFWGFEWHQFPRIFNFFFIFSRVIFPHSVVYEVLILQASNKKFSDLTCSENIFF